VKKVTASLLRTFKDGNVLSFKNETRDESTLFMPDAILPKAINNSSRCHEPHSGY